jgi:hypothetical protein
MFVLGLLCRALWQQPKLCRHSCAQQFFATEVLSELNLLSGSISSSSSSSSSISWTKRIAFTSESPTEPHKKKKNFKKSERIQTLQAISFLKHCRQFWGQGSS